MINKIVWHFKNNLVVQFSVSALVVTALIAILIATVLGIRLNHNMEHLNEHGMAMMSGERLAPSDHISVASITTDVRRLRNVTYGIVGGGFLVLYGLLVFIVARGWNTIQKQRIAVAKSREELQRKAIPVILQARPEAGEE